MPFDPEEASVGVSIGREEGMVKKGDIFCHSFVVTEKIWQGFMELFGDRNPIHTDRAYAQGKGFKDIIMFGNILNGFLSFFIGELLPLKNVIIHTQEIKFANPVYLNDTLKFVAEVIDISESVNVIEFKYYFQNQNNLKVAKGKIQIGIL